MQDSDCIFFYFYSLGPIQLSTFTIYIYLDFFSSIYNQTLDNRLIISNIHAWLIVNGIVSEIDFKHSCDSYLASMRLFDERKLTKIIWNYVNYFFFIHLIVDESGSIIQSKYFRKKAETEIYELIVARTWICKIESKKLQSCTLFFIIVKKYKLKSIRGNNNTKREYVTNFNDYLFFVHFHFRTRAVVFLSDLLHCESIHNSWVFFAFRDMCRLSFVLFHINK